MNKFWVVWAFVLGLCIGAGIQWSITKDFKYEYKLLRCEKFKEHVQKQLFNCETLGKYEEER